jgi:hypothetical protein
VPYAQVLGLALGLGPTELGMSASE